MTSSPLRRVRSCLLLLLWPIAGTGCAASTPGRASPPQQLPLEGFWCPGPTPPSPAAAASRVPAGCVGLEVPRTQQQQSLGLQLRPPLPADRGMWFPFRPARIARFWMHRTPNPLDMVFVQQGRIVAIQPAATPCMQLPCPSYGPDEPVDGVLELAAGQAAHRGLRVGGELKVELLVPIGLEAPAPD